MSTDSPGMPRLSIIVVTYNSRRDIDTCLRSLTDAAPHADYEVVVVDNASADGTAAYVRETWPGVRLLESGDNVGFARANNLGIRQTFGELVLLLNPDTAIRPGALDALVGSLDRRPGAAVAGPRIVDEHGQPELSFGPMISPLAELRQKLLVRGNDRRVPPIPAIVAWLTGRSRVVDWVSGACLLVRRADLEAVGLLDERFFLYTEDVDLCASIRARGREVLFVAEAEIIHLRGRSASASPGATANAYRRSHLAFYEKHHPDWVPVLKAYRRLTALLGGH